MLQNQNTTESTLTTISQGASLTQRARIGEQADRAAANNVFADYLSRKAENTLKRQTSDLKVFAEYLAQVQIQASAVDLQQSPDAWQGMTWGLIEGFVKWQLLKGYAIGTVNVRLSTVKRYAGLAFKAGVIDSTQHALIKTVQGYSQKEARHMDEQREAQGLNTRREVEGLSQKKARHTGLSDRQAAELKAQDLETPQGRRDAVIMTILIDHGLRVGELAGLTVDNINFEENTLTFYRPKVGKEQTHKLSPDTLAALTVWRDEGDMPLAGSLLRSSRKGGHLTDAGMSTRAINKRVGYLGEKAGIKGLSPHDLRHYGATKDGGRVERGEASLFNLQEKYGWSSLSMARRYVETAKVANKNLV